MNPQSPVIETPVLVVGAGPAGMVASLQLARLGIRHMLVERNHETTKWPKMNLTNCRTMELFRRIGIADSFREIGNVLAWNKFSFMCVETKYSCDSIFHSGLSEGGQTITKWEMPSPDEWRATIKEENDGTQPREPYQRCSQAIFEKWFRPLVEAEPSIDCRWGVKFESLEEDDDCVTSRLTETATSKEFTVKSKYVIGCDGAGSRVRRNIAITLLGGPLDGAAYLVHFKSKDLDRLRKSGQCWHIFFVDGGTLIAQDEKETWTVHKPIGLDVDISKLDPYQTIYDVLGAATKVPYPVKVDEILVVSSWRPNICIAEKYTSAKSRVFLSGDSAHQNIPTGGYGYNTAVGDSVDITWKIAAILKGYGGQGLLDSYEIERRPVAVQNLEYSGYHMETHQIAVKWVKASGHGVVLSDSPEGKELRRRIRDHFQKRDGENKFFGLELGYRYNGSPVVVPDLEVQEPRWTLEDYHPSTWPGARPPHVYLVDNETSIFDLFGQDFTLVDFSADRRFIKEFEPAASKGGIPVKMVHLPDEPHVKKIWERQAILVRPDQMVTWRANVAGEVPDDVEFVLRIATGQQLFTSVLEAQKARAKQTAFVAERGFTGTVGNENQDTIAMTSVWQQNV
ncbi:FAD binding domain-containing protein [Dactylonectria macrodidyma]|uniref:FAD binding domain-containing protein n=1 Tax=Dactylonectria macrodidyma TaxID=307937 RepID=A0A9P9IGS2_9HYPO|nr:FAD binding domain-containing protein [Dactylonectria macrodidyma]